MQQPFLSAPLCLVAASVAQLHSTEGDVVSPRGACRSFGKVNTRTGRFLQYSAGGQSLSGAGSPA